MNIFLDTNIYLRYLVPEDQIKYHECTQIISLFEQKKILVYISDTVIQELIYTLTKTYAFKKQKVIDWLNQLFFYKPYFIEKSDILRAYDLYKNQSIKFGDCLIVTQVPKDAILCTYDDEFDKIAGLKIMKPAELIKAL